MTKAFQKAISKILSQQSDLDGGDEQAIEQVVIPPILRSIGWDIYSLAEVSRQESLDEGKVDYALKIGGENRVLLEAKAWHNKLDDHVDQIRKYLKPKPRKDIREMAVLTNGRQWRFYLPPRTRGNEKDLQWFLQFNITSGDSSKVEKLFREFLARKSIASIEETVKAALKKEGEMRRAAVVKRGLGEALIDLTTDKLLLEEVLRGIVEEKGIHPTKLQLRQFVNSEQARLEITKPTHNNKPTSFEFHSKGKIIRDTVRNWPDLKRKFCRIIYKLHRKQFGNRVMRLPGDWFAHSEDNRRSYAPIDDSGISLKSKGSREGILKLRQDLLDAFGYDPKALIVYQS